MQSATDHVLKCVRSFFAKGEYVPRNLGKFRRPYHDALESYKDAYGLGPHDDVPHWILDDIAELVKKGIKPADIPYEAPPMPEEDEDNSNE